MIRGRLWRQSQQITELENGGCRLTMRLSVLEEIERWVLSWGTHATVVQPDRLALRVRVFSDRLMERYRGIRE